METVKLTAAALALAGLVLVGCEQGGTGQTGSPSGAASPGTPSGAGGGSTAAPGQAPGGAGGAQPAKSPQ